LDIKTRGKRKYSIVMRNKDPRRKVKSCRFKDFAGNMGGGGGGKVTKEGKHDSLILAAPNKKEVNLWFYMIIRNMEAITSPVGTSISSNSGEDQNKKGKSLDLQRGPPPNSSGVSFEEARKKKKNMESVTGGSGDLNKKKKEKKESGNGSGSGAGGGAGVKKKKATEGVTIDTSLSGAPSTSSRTSIDKSTRTKASSAEAPRVAKKSSNAGISGSGAGGSGTTSSPGTSNAPQSAAGAGISKGHVPSPLSGAKAMNLIAGDDDASNNNPTRPRSVRVAGAPTGSPAKVSTGKK